MPRESKEVRETRVHEEALSEFDEVQSAQQDERQQCVNDRRFTWIPGAQWEGPLSGVLDGHPKMEFNKVQSAVVRVINEMRSANIGIRFAPRDPDAEADDDLADMVAGMLRADEYDSSADEAYGNGFEEAVSGGFGAWQLRADYVDEDDEDGKQRIRIEPIYDADTSVYFDLGAKEQDKSDAKRCWVLKSMTPNAYKAEFDRDPSTWPKMSWTTQFDWCTPDVVYVCEYYRIEKKKKNVEVWKGPTGELKDLNVDDDYETDEEYEADTARMFSLGWRLSEKNNRTHKEVRKYILDGGGVIEDCGPIPGKYIPVIPVVGKRLYIDNVERFAGVARYVADSQRLKNMQLSRLAELSALSPIEVPIFTAEQVAGHELSWSKANVDNKPYRVINGVDENGGQLPQGPMAYTRSPQVPPALAALIGLTEQEIRDILGNTDQAEKMLSGVSGETVSLLQQRVDGMNAIYITNHAKAKRHTARVYLHMAADVYVEDDRTVRMMSEDGDVAFAKINTPKMGAEGQLLEGLTFERAKFDVYADVGPNSGSARQATVRALTGMMQMTQDPEDMRILLSMALMNMDGEGVNDVRKFYRKRLVGMGVIPPTEQEQQEMAEAAANAKPDPQAAFLESEAEKNKAQATSEMADAQRTMADARLKVAQTAKTEAETVATITGVQRGPR